MSRDKRLNRTQEVVGSSPINSTNCFKYLDIRVSFHCLRRKSSSRLVAALRLSVSQQLARCTSASNSGARRFDQDRRSLLPRNAIAVRTRTGGLPDLECGGRAAALVGLRSFASASVYSSRTPMP